MRKGCISKGSKIWMRLFAKTIFDLQLHGILAIKGSAWRNGNPSKDGSSPGEMETRQKVEITPESIR